MIRGKNKILSVIRSLVIQTLQYLPTEREYGMIKKINIFLFLSLSGKEHQPLIQEYYKQILCVQ